MMNIVKSFFRSTNLSVLKLWKLDTQLESIEKSINELSTEYTVRNESRKKLVKENIDRDIIKSVDSRFKLFTDSYLEELFLLKKKRDELIKHRKQLLSNKNINKAYKEYNRYFQFKKAYKDDLVDVKVFDTFIKARNGKVRYGDSIVFNENNELLILKRAKHDDTEPDTWVIPGGHIDIGEDFETGAKRELEEESGLRVDKFEKIGTYSNNDVEIEYYKTIIDTEEKPIILQESEIQSYKWINPWTEIDKYMFPFNMRENIKTLLNIETKVVTITKSEADLNKSDGEKTIKEDLNELITEHKRLIKLLEEFSDNPKVSKELEIQKKELLKYEKKAGEEIEKSFNIFEDLLEKSL